MTNPRHHRITSNGEITFLEMYKEAFSYNPNIPGTKKYKRKYITDIIEMCLKY